MKTVIYSKFSAERSRSFAIRTDILCGDDGSRMLRKTACFPEGDGHVAGMEKAGKALGDLFAGTDVVPCPVLDGEEKQDEKGRRCLAFAYIDGKETLAQRAHRMRARGQEKEADQLIRGLADQILALADVPFAKSEEFTRVFGDAALPEGLMSLPVTDVDMVLDNFLVREDSSSLDLIDYEWTFFFPVPVRFALYRTLHYFWHREMEDSPETADTAASAQLLSLGATREEIAAYAQMEASLQAYIAEGVTPVRELFAQITPGAVTLEDLGFGAGGRTDRILAGSLYWSKTGQIAEESRIAAVTSLAADGTFRAQLPVREAAGAVLLRWDPLEGSCCRIRIDKIETDDSIRIRPLNGTREDGWLLFRTFDPILLIEGEVGALERLVISGKMELLPVAGLIGRLNDEAMRAAQLEQQVRSGDAHLAAVQSTKGWRAMEKLRAARNYVAARAHALPFMPAGQAPPDPYSVWFEKHRAGEADLEAQRITSLRTEPKISILVPTYRTPADFLRDMVSSVQAQTYSNWELCIADASVSDDGTGRDMDLKRALEAYAQADPRIRVVFLDRNGGISENTNAAAKLATGEYITLLDHDDVLAPDALFETAAAIGRTGADVLYTDEDKVSMDLSTHFDPNLKPDFSPDLLCSHNYITHLFVVSAELFRQAGGFDSRYDGAQDYDLIFRCTEKAQKIVHIPKILYHWRMHRDSTAANPKSKMYAYEAGRSAIEAHMRRMGQSGRVEMMKLWALNHVIYDTPGDPLVSIIIPNKDHRWDLTRCIDSILAKSSYQNLEIIIVENNSTRQETFACYDELCAKDGRIRVLRWKEGFNYSAINNFAAREANGSYLLFLNNDTELMEPDSIREMLGHCMQPETGCVGAKLFFQDDTVQHAGIVLGFGGFAGHVFSGLKSDDLGFMMRAQITCNYSAVTAACMMVRRDVFEQVGGFEEQYAVALNDVDFCLKVRKAGYYNVFVPFAQWHHYESKSRGYEDTPEKQARFQREIDLFRSRWGDLVDAGDPFYNPNFAVDRAPYTLRED